jgi:hypothetical protein
MTAVDIAAADQLDMQRMHASGCARLRILSAVPSGESPIDEGPFPLDRA